MYFRQRSSYAISLVTVSLRLHTHLFPPGSFLKELILILIHTDMPVALETSGRLIPIQKCLKHPYTQREREKTTNPTDVLQAHRPFSRQSHTIRQKRIWKPDQGFVLLTSSWFGSVFTFHGSKKKRPLVYSTQREFEFWNESFYTTKK